MKSSNGKVINSIMLFSSKLVEAKSTSLVEIETSDLYDNSIDVDYICAYVGAPVRLHVRKAFLEQLNGNCEWDDVRLLAATTVIKELLFSNRDVFGFIATGKKFNEDLIATGGFNFTDECFKKFDSGLSDLLPNAKSPIELMNWYYSRGCMGDVEEAMRGFDDFNSVQFIEHAGGALERSLDALYRNCIQHNAFFESMIQVFIFCKCAQLMKEDGVNICRVYLKAVKLVEEYSNLVEKCAYTQLSLAYTLGVIFNVTKSKCETLKMIMREFPVLDHFMLGGVLNCNDSNDALHSRIQNNFFKVLSEEDVSFFKLSVDDKLRISYLG